MLAACPAHTLLRQYGRGRAREAIAYLAGLAAGLALTAALLFVFPVVSAGRIAEAGLIGAFFGPFAGMLRAKWERPRRRAGRPRARRASRPPWDGLSRARPGR
jgi:hypothetical protein